MGRRRPPRGDENNSPAVARSGFGLAITGVGGLLTSGTYPTTVGSYDAPTPLDDKELRFSGERGTGGFSTDFFGRIDDFRLGAGGAFVFSRHLDLSSQPLPNSFGAHTGSALAGSAYAMFGRQLRFFGNNVLPYADLLVGVSFLQAPVHLDHPQFGYLGQTPYQKFRFSLGPRIGVQIPIAGPFLIDIAARYDIFGFFTVGGQAGIVLFFGP